MASYINININTVDAPHFAIWYHDRSIAAVSYLTAAVLNYAVTKQFLMIGYVPKDVSINELPKTFQIRVKNNEILSDWEKNLKKANLKKRRMIEYILEHSISTDEPVQYSPAEMDMKIADLTCHSLPTKEESGPYNSQSSDTIDEKKAVKAEVTASTDNISQNNNPERETKPSSIVIQKNDDSNNLFINQMFAGLE